MAHDFGGRRPAGDRRADPVPLLESYRIKRVAGRSAFPTASLLRDDGRRGGADQRVPIADRAA
jgi:hypothetical protein